MDSDVIIVGAGPIGGYLGKSLSDNKIKVIQIEEHLEIGRPFQCAGLVTPSAMDKVGLHDTTLTDVWGARMHAPNGSSIEIGSPSRIREHVVCRKRFDEAVVRQGVDSGVEKVIKYLNKKSRKVTGKKIDQVATISANNDKELGKVIGEAFRLVDETGVVMMETNEQPETIVELIEGVQYDQALKNNHFITNIEKGTAELENPLVLIVESVIPNVRKIQSVLEFIIKNGKSLLIIADVDPQVVSALAMNKKKGNIKVNIVDAPTYGISKKDVLSDLCAVTGATLILSLIHI